MLSSTLHNGQLVLTSLGAGFCGGLGSVTCLVSGFFSTVFSTFCTACGLVSPTGGILLESGVTADPLRDEGGVVLADTWETVDPFREVGGVMEDSS